MGDQDGAEIYQGNNVYADVIAASPCTTGDEFEWTYDSYWGEWYCPGYCYTADKITDPDDADLCLDDCEYGYTECVEGDDCYVADSIFGKCNATGEWDSQDETAYKCLDAFWCPTVAPGSDSTVWQDTSDERNGSRFSEEYRIGYFEQSDSLYAPCVEWADMEANWQYYNLNNIDGRDCGGSERCDALYNSKSVTAQPMMHLCSSGRALKCDTSQFEEATDLAGDTTYMPTCIADGEPTEDGRMSPAWILTDYLGEPAESFDVLYPHCLPSSSKATADYLQTDEGIADEAAQLLAATLKFDIQKPDHWSTKITWLSWFDDAENDGANPYFWGPDYGEELPLHYDGTGNLCADMYSVSDAAGRILLAANDGIFDPTAALITAQTAAEDYPQNVQNIMSFMSEEDFNSLIPYQKTVTVDGVEQPFTTFWDFLSAVAKAPAFCNGVAGPLYSRFSAEALCAREAAGVAATMIMATNEDDAEKEVDGNLVPLSQQGLFETEDTFCNDSTNFDDELCTQLATDTDAIDTFYQDAMYEAQVDTDTTRYGYRGAGHTYGADQYYWMSQVLYGDNTIFANPSLLATDPETFWLSGLMRWMIPMNGLPAPHNIMLGQWEPTEAELEVGLTQGFGAVSALFYGASQCGTQQNPTANTRTAIYEDIIGSIEAYDGSWSASDTVYEWEANSCTESKRGDFPLGDYYFPQFIVSTIGDLDWDSFSAPGGSAIDANGYNAFNCWFVDTPEILNSGAADKIYIMWQRDAYRNCLLDHPRFRMVTMNAIWEVPEGEDVIFEQLLEGAEPVYCSDSVEEHEIDTSANWTGETCIQNCYTSTWAAHHYANYEGIETAPEVLYGPWATDGRRGLATFYHAAFLPAYEEDGVPYESECWCVVAPQLASADVLTADWCTVTSRSNDWDAEWWSVSSEPFSV